MDKNRRKIIGRTKELRRFSAALQQTEAQFIALYGRRRVGKTFLVREYFKDKVALEFCVTGQHQADTAQQLAIFQSEFERCFYNLQKTFTPITNWKEAFTNLAEALEIFQAQQGAKPILIFLDELPWLAAADDLNSNLDPAGLLQALDHIWNTKLQYVPGLLLIVCGSAASWMINALINDKGGLHNRLTAHMRVMPFDLSESKIFLNTRGIDWPNSEILNTYLTFGGVPYYLNLLDAQASLTQNIQDLCFGSGELHNEFGRLVQALFNDSQEYQLIISKLAAHHMGQTKQELLRDLGLTSNGTFSQRLRVLEESGFVQVLPNFGKVKRDKLYRVSDEFSLFTCRWLLRAKEETVSTERNYWAQRMQTPNYNTWLGYAFEGLCLKHVPQIQEALGFGSVQSSAAPLYVKGDSKTKGFQIDLVFDRADKVITLLEIKYRNGPLLLDKKLYDQLQEKKARFIAHSATRKTVQLAVLANDGVLENQYSQILGRNVIAGEVLLRG